MYMAPEIIANQPYQGTSIDIFALGVAILVLRAKRYPFDQASLADKNYRLLQEKPDEFWGPYKERCHISDDLTLLLSGMLQSEPSGRPTMADVIGSQWMRGDVATQEQFQE